MISRVRRRATPNGNERPYVNADDDGGRRSTEGQTATMTGTYDDPDGDAVTLSASVGTVTPTGGGNWTWSYPTTDGPDAEPARLRHGDRPGGRRTRRSSS